MADKDCPPDFPEIPPHEQDDPDLASRSTGTLVSPLVQNTNRWVSGGFAGMTSIGISPAPAIKTIIQGADPVLEFDDGDVILTLEGGRETYFASASGAPLFVDGSKRRFRFTREEAQELTRKLARMLAEHSDD